MITAKKNARGQAGVQLELWGRDSAEYSAPSPTCGKAAAMALYDWEILSLEAVDRIFARHSEWKPA